MVVSKALLTLCLLLGCLANNSASFSLLARAKPFKLTGSDLDLASSPLLKDETAELSFGELSRRYRRSFYGVPDWTKHRSTDRFFANFATVLKSGVVRQLLRQLYLLAGIASVICLYNAFFVVGFVDFSGVNHAALRKGWPMLKMPIEFFTLSSPALGLLLVFKTNSSYQRWDEARKAWGMVVNSTRSIMRQAAAWIRNADIPQTEKLRHMVRLATACWVFPRCLARHLLPAREDDRAFTKEIRDFVRKDLAEDLIAAPHRPTRALYELSCAISDLPLTDFQRVTLDNHVTVLCDGLGACDRILSSPVPMDYARHTSRFMDVWLMLLPFALYQPFAVSWNHVAMIPFTVVISFFFLGIEELSVQLEEPFSILPLHAMTNSMRARAQEAVQWFLKGEVKDSKTNTNSMYSHSSINGAVQ